jgi:hypothetical protein
MHNILLRFRLTAAFVSGVAGLAAAASPASAAFVYEPFQGYTASVAIVGQNPNANTIGLDQTLPYSGSANFNVTNTGLTFSNLSTAGGAITFSNSTGSTAGAETTTATAFSGTLYHSSLFRSSGVSGSTSNGIAIQRINTNGDTGSGNSRFRAEILSSSTTSDDVAAAYDDTSITGSGRIAANQTFLLLGRYTRVGATLTSGNPGVATVYALSSAQFDFFRQDNTITDLELDSAAIGTAAGQIYGRAEESLATGSSVFNTGDAIQFAGQNGGTLTFDEIRYGVSFDDVTPVPEPSGALLLATLCPLFIRRQSKR